MKNFVIVLASLVISASSFAGGNRVGNGGGAWVCRENSGEIRWSESVDLYEANSEYGLVLDHFTGSYTQIVAQLMPRLAPEITSPFSVGDFRPDILSLGNLNPIPGKIMYLNETLPVIEDALYTQVPKKTNCANGALNYEQVVNYRSDGTILIQSQLFESLPEISKAALLVHEGVYAHRRTENDVNSLISRRIVGLVFSTLPANEVGQLIAELYFTNVTMIKSGSYSISATFIDNNGDLQPFSFAKVLMGAWAGYTSANLPTEMLVGANLNQEGNALIQMTDSDVEPFLTAPSIAITIDQQLFSGTFAHGFGWAIQLTETHDQNSAYSCSALLLAAQPNIPNEIRISCVQNEIIKSLFDRP